MGSPRCTVEKFKPLGGPDGGNGGDGGSVILRVEHGLTTLVDYHRQSHRRAPTASPDAATTTTVRTARTWCCPCPTAPW